MSSLLNILWGNLSALHLVQCRYQTLSLNRTWRRSNRIPHSFVNGLLAMCCRSLDAANLDRPPPFGFYFGDHLLYCLEGRCFTCIILGVQICSFVVKMPNLSMNGNAISFSIQSIRCHIMHYDFIYASVYINGSRKLPPWWPDNSHIVESRGNKHVDQQILSSVSVRGRSLLAFNPI